MRPVVRLPKVPDFIDLDLRQGREFFCPLLCALLNAQADATSGTIPALEQLPGAKGVAAREERRASHVESAVEDEMRDARCLDERPASREFAVNCRPSQTGSRVYTGPSHERMKTPGWFAVALFIVHSSPWQGCQDMHKIHSIVLRVYTASPGWRILCVTRWQRLRENGA